MQEREFWRIQDPGSDRSQQEVLWEDARTLDAEQPLPTISSLVTQADQVTSPGRFKAPSRTTTIYRDNSEEIIFPLFLAKSFLNPATISWADLYHTLSQATSPPWSSTV